MEATPNAYSPLLTTGSKLPEGSKNSQSPEAATGTITLKTLQTNPSFMNQPRPRKAETFQSWGAPAGLPIPSNNNENLLIFRKALGINLQRDVADSNGTLEEGRKKAIGIYRSVIETQTRMLIQHALLTAFLYLVYFAQIIIGAALTALGSSAARFETTITILGAFNTVLAGVLALIKGSGQPQKLGKDRVGYRRLQDWIEETEALLAVGVIGRNRKEVGLLVESAFKRYNAAKASEENNDPDFYVYHPQEPIGNRPSDDGGAHYGNDHEATK
ncbi:hypothetical protein F5B22DRAFT_525756 [Xylaria bambusicola]|uniref:uncharacterized protein n=1 Tax=Xylaria bambusicola TaxID=326684 RepID=UPI002008A3F1|nr:uncharacterized protein F5B22DRAFT_525756 [Xylaria bambusicola]KAI0505478.1 hypothetical protein F5B22DRAFT_525756 [Xylaria bambusicola]